jgi:hypothetical protein
MPTISTGVKSLDVLTANNTEQLVGLINDVIRNIPELGFFDAAAVKRNEYNTLVLTQLPKVGFRKPNMFGKHESPKLDMRTVKCAYLDASGTIDRALAEQFDWGKEFAQATLQMAHLQSAFFELSQQIWYGSKNEVDGFNGLLDFVDKANPEMQIDAGGSGTGLTSVFAVSTGLNSCQIAWGSEGHFTEDAIEKTWIPDPSDPNNGGRWDYAQDLGGYWLCDTKNID